jgi:hypothetical protein
VKDYYGFVYLWENTHPEAKIHKKYIGQHVGNVEDDYIGSGSIFLRRFYSKKYRGFWKRTILEHCMCLDDLNQSEMKWIKQYNAQNDPLFCNIRGGGESGGKHSKAFKIKMSKIKKGSIPWNKGLKGCYKLKDETKKKILKAKKIFHDKIRNQDYKAILKYIKQNHYAQRADIPKILQRKVSSTIVTNRINDLVKQNKIKKLRLAFGHVHYVLSDNI